MVNLSNWAYCTQIAIAPKKIVEGLTILRQKIYDMLLSSLYI